MRNLEMPLSELHGYVPHAERSRPAVSAVNVGWHIGHSLLVIIRIIETASKSDPDKYKWKFNIARALIFTLNKFPRGKGKAPDVVKPKENEKADFDALFEKARRAVGELNNLPPNHYFEHPILGSLNKKNIFVLLDIHTRHHLHIIKDIVSP